VFEAFLGRRFLIEPLEPAEIDEDGATDDAAGGRLEVAVRLEVETQRGVGALVGGKWF